MRFRLLIFSSKCQREREKTAPVGIHFREARGDPKLGPSFINDMMLHKFSQHHWYDAAQILTTPRESWAQLGITQDKLHHKCRAL